MIDPSVWFHYDVEGDVLYLRRVKHRKTPAVGEMTSGGVILLKTEESDELVGVTIVDWWRTNGEGAAWSSRESFERVLERTAKTLPLAA